MNTNDIGEYHPDRDDATPPATVSWRIRPATAADLPAIFRLYDEAVVWLNARGITDQWGTTPVSERPHLVEEVRESLSRGFVVVDDGSVAGFMELETGTPDYIASLIGPAASAEGAYVHSLVARKSPPASGAGAALLGHAETLARAANKSCLRLNCWAGNPRLIAYYESQGFARRFGDEQDDRALMERRWV